MYLKLKIVLLSILPVAIALVLVTMFVRYQANQLVQQQVAALERYVIADKEQELKNYTELALSSIEPFLQSDVDDPEAAAQAAAQVVLILESMTFTEDGYFFAYERDGTNVLHPKQPWRVGENWWDVQDPEGVYIIRDLVAAAENGGGFVRYAWERPTTGVEAPKLSYAVMIEPFDWMIGTGVYLDEIGDLVATLRNDVETRVSQFFVLISIIFGTCVLAVGGFISVLAYRETSFADGKLRELYNDIVDVQEDERARVSRELHDGISQILVSAKYALALAKTRLEKLHPGEEVALDNGFARIDQAIQEVRRISSDLRPKDLDDLGLAAALRTLGKQFEKSTGLTTHVEASPVNQALDSDQKSALYRIAQEALTNIERHAEASAVTITLRLDKKQVSLSIQDNGRGLNRDEETAHHSYRGMGIRNMEERMAVLSGRLNIQCGKPPMGGTILLATVPLPAQVPSDQAGNASAAGAL